MKEFLIAFFVGLFSTCLIGLAVMLTWNWLMPVLFGFKTLTYWQGVGMTLLAECLFESHLPKKIKD